MKVYVVFLNKKTDNGWIEETIGVCSTPQLPNDLLDGRYGGFCEYQLF